MRTPSRIFTHGFFTTKNGANVRQGQQNRRGRGRNRKSQNPLTRSFESTGPDVKIRGTPAHIAEKYMSLARDASASGDPVLAENYLQHAEHYNRIIMSFRDQQMSQGGEGVNGAIGRHRQFAAQESAESAEDLEVENADSDAQPPHPPLRQHASMSQPRAEGHRGGQEQPRSRGRSDRQERGGSRGGGRGFRQSAEASGDGDGQPPAAESQSPRSERFAQSHEQPEFLRRPVRRPRRDGNGGSTEANGGTVTDDADHD
ncbi:MAG: DUF4167 domain-containing protein [Hyphomicrobium sp.]